jgi:hypothetical protein
MGFISLESSPRPSKSGRNYHRYRVKGCNCASIQDREYARSSDLPAKMWIMKHHFSNGRYHVQITIEGHLAFKRDIRLGPVLF